MKLTKILQRENYDVSENDVLDAVEKCGHFAVFYKKKLFPYFDFKLACEDDDIRAVSNVKVVTFHSAKCRIVSVEDLVIKKLEWGDLKDVESVLIRYKEKIDMNKLYQLAKTKHLHEKLQDLIKNSTGQLAE